MFNAKLSAMIDWAIIYIIRSQNFDFRQIGITNEYFTCYLVKLIIEVIINYQLSFSTNANTVLNSSSEDLS